MRSAALRVLLLLTLLSPAARGTGASEAVACEASRGRGILEETYLQKLRICAWRLLEPLTHRTKGFPDERAWVRADRVLPDLETRGALRPAERLTALRAAKPASEPDLYELSFFNRVAADFIQSGPDRLDRPETTEALLAKNVREIQFPSGSAALKTFWYRLPEGQALDVRIWDWAATTPRTAEDAGALRLDVERLRRQCIVDTTATRRQLATKGRQCLVASEVFYTIEVGTEDVFRCARAQCPLLAQGDSLILVGLHIASKQMPEWLWATWWWQGPVTQGDAWTCGAAQRPEAIRAASPWANYAMNVTASFRKEKPVLAADEPCGAPAPLPDGQERRATYNPFVEAREENGLKSSCVDCHSRASTKSAAELVTPGIGESGGPPVAGFEGHLRLDYLWSLRRSLNKTRTLPRDR